MSRYLVLECRSYYGRITETAAKKLQGIASVDASFDTYEEAQEFANECNDHLHSQGVKTIWYTVR